MTKHVNRNNPNVKSFSDIEKNKLLCARRVKGPTGYILLCNSTFPAVPAAADEMLH